jgi:hypothetical protein
MDRQLRVIIVESVLMLSVHSGSLTSRRRQSQRSQFRVHQLQLSKLQQHRQLLRQHRQLLRQLRAIIVESVLMLSGHVFSGSLTSKWHAKDKSLKTNRCFKIDWMRSRLKWIGFENRFTPQ